MWLAKEVTMQTLNHVAYGSYWWWEDILAHVRNEVHAEKGRVDFVQISTNNVFTMPITEDTSY